MLSGLQFRSPLGSDVFFDLSAASLLDAGFFWVVMGQTLYVVIKAEDGACKEEGLRDIQQYTIGHVIDAEHLRESHANAGENQQHGAGILCGLVVVLHCV